MLLNVCGLSSKLDCEEFIDKICEYDIISFCETKTDDIDKERLEEVFHGLGYIIYLQNRHNFTHWRSGGVMIAIKDSLSHQCKRLSTNNDNMVIVRLDKRLLRVDKHIIFIALYIPPYGTRYSNVDLFDALSDEVLNYSSDEYYHLISGDLNAHTGVRPDIVTFDATLCDCLGIDEDTKSRLEITQTMETLGLPVSRASTDQQRDNGNYGEGLLQMCINNMLCIFNGRTGSDNGKGKATTTDGTLIDYVIGSPFILGLTPFFNVLDFDALFSDKHSIVEFEVSVKGPYRSCQDVVAMNSNSSSESFSQGIPDEQTEKVVWRPEEKDLYISRIDKDSIVHLCNTLDVDNISVQEATSQLNEILLEPASRLPRRPRKVAKRRNKHANYSTATRRMRQDYHKAKHKNNIEKTCESKEELKRKSRLYKKELQKVIKKSKKVTTDKLRQLKNTNAKEYWKILQSRNKDEIPIKLTEMFQHFKNLAEASEGEEIQTDEDDINMADLDTSTLNNVFTEDEIRRNIRNLKNNKSGGIDGLLNEHIKSTADLLMPLYVKLFNKVLNCADIPEEWAIGLIIPLFKQKGDRYDCDNYRGITLLSCMGKLFTSILNERLYKFCEYNKILKEIQAGFRKGYSTLDHIFVLKAFIDMYLARKRKLFCCFVDYSKAFDTVCRQALWHKLLRYGISGKVLDVMKSLYSNVKSCVFLNGQKSEYFVAARGVRQGENLSPLLFALYVNDIEDFMCNDGCQPVQFTDSILDSYMKLLVLMYADDTIILADSEINLQAALNSLSEYCKKWHLSVNETKTKIIIFGKRKTPKEKFTFKFRQKALEIVEDYKYLGLIINYNGSFKSAISALKCQASRAMYSLISKCRRLSLPIDIQLHLFDALVLPIMLYGCEIWGTGDYEELEILHRKFLKHILRVSGKTTNNMVYGELGRYPLDVTIKKRMLCYWGRILIGKQSKLSKQLYDNLHGKFLNSEYSNKWLLHIKNILQECGMSDTWNAQDIRSIASLKATADKELKANFVRKWKNELSEMTSCDLYLHLKPDFKIEKYLLNLDQSLRTVLCKLRTNNTRLPKVVGRYKKPKIERHKRYCQLCDCNLLGDEFHLIFECNHERVVHFRNKYIPVYYKRKPSMLKCVNLLRSENIVDNIKLSLFMRHVLPLYR